MIFGAGSLGLTALDLFQRNNVVVYGLLDDNKDLHGTEFGEVSVLGETDDDGYLKLIGQKCEAFVAIGDSRVRKRLVKLLNERRKMQPVNAIHDSAVVSKLVVAAMGTSLVTMPCVAATGARHTASGGGSRSRRHAC